MLYNLEYSFTYTRMDYQGITISQLRFFCLNTQLMIKFCRFFYEGQIKSHEYCDKNFKPFADPDSHSISYM